jgi:hypothetical protein
MKAHADRSLLQVITLTFINHFLLALLVVITLPSLLMSFLGVLLGAGRTVLWGSALSHTDPSYGIKIITHSLTGLLEGQGYILAMLGAYLLWRYFFHPHQLGESSSWRGYMIGL